MQELIINQFDFSRLNLLFVITGVLLTTFTLLSASNYIKQNKKWYYLVNFIYIVSFSLLILTNNWFIFIITWELVTVTTTIMLIWSSRRIAFQYFILQFIGSSFLLFVILMAVSLGYESVGTLGESWLQNMFIFALGMKSAIFGLHFWLPPVHSMAPSPVSAVLSGWVVKLGFITYLKLMPDGNRLLLYLGFLMIFYGGIKAVLATDYKVLLAYSTISQLGFIALGIGSGTDYGSYGAVFHIAAHGLAKTSLFIGSGYWIKEYGSRSIYRFSSAFKRQKLTSYGTVTAFLSLMGLPLLAGYNSKYLIKYGLKGGSSFLLLLLYAASIMTMLYALRFLKLGLVNSNLNSISGPGTFTGKSKSNYQLKLNEKMSIFLPAVLLIGLGLFPDILINFFSSTEFDFHLLTGFRDNFLYILLALIPLLIFKWIRVEEQEPPSLDELFKKIYNLIYSFSEKAKEYDADQFFESFLYRNIFNLSRSLYRIVFSSFQTQLLWIPVFILVLLLWRYIS